MSGKKVAAVQAAEQSPNERSAVLVTALRIAQHEGVTLEDALRRLRGLRP